MTSRLQQPAAGPVAARRRTARRRQRAGLAGLLGLVAATVGARAATSAAPHSALAGPLPVQRQLPATAGPPATASAPTARSAPPGGTRSAAPGPLPTRTATGEQVDVGYGLVQVRVTVQGTRITSVTAVSLPQGGRSTAISAYAAPQLAREALAAQAATIDMVSGASYTSQGYARSLQSALDAAR